MRPAPLLHLARAGVGSALRCQRLLALVSSRTRFFTPISSPLCRAVHRMVSDLQLDDARALALRRLSPAIHSRPCARLAHASSSAPAARMSRSERAARARGVAGGRPQRLAQQRRSSGTARQRQLGRARDSSSVALSGARSYLRLRRASSEARSSPGRGVADRARAFAAGVQVRTGRRASRSAGALRRARPPRDVSCPRDRRVSSAIPDQRASGALRAAGAWTSMR